MNKQQLAARIWASANQMLRRLTGDGDDMAGIQELMSLLGGDAR